MSEHDKADVEECWMVAGHVEVPGVIEGAVAVCAEVVDPADSAFVLLGDDPIPTLARLHQEPA